VMYEVVLMVLFVAAILVGFFLGWYGRNDG
jgi:hypothetical protein